MTDLRDDLERARELDVGELAAAIRSIGFECTRCGACCRGHGEEHTATVFPDEVRRIAGVGGAGPDAADAYDWRDVVRPVPFGLEAVGEGDPDDGAATGGDGRSGETFEWALQMDACGDCAFYDDGPADGPGTCTVYPDRPLICRTYPFSVELGGSAPLGEVVVDEGPVHAHECEGLGREIDEADAMALARALKERAIREVEEMVAVRENHEPANPDSGEVVVHDSAGAKNPDGTPYR